MWNVHQPVEIVFGVGERNNIGKILRKHGFERSLLICDPIMTQFGHAQKVQENSDGIIAGIYDKVEPDCSVVNVNEAVDLAHELGATSLVAMGGGSTTDCTKMTAACLADGITGEQIIAGTHPKHTVPFIAMPTTAGSGSEVTCDASLHDKKTGAMAGEFSNPALFATAAVVDPELTYTVPVRPAAQAGYDVLSHDIDAMISRAHNPYSDALGVQGAKLVLNNLAEVVKNPDDHTARDNMAQASILSGLAFSQTSVNGSHACAFAISAKYGVGHGEAVAFTLDWWFRKGLEARPDLEDLVKTIGFESGEQMAQALVDLRSAAGLRSRLSDFGYQAGDEEFLADFALNVPAFKAGLVNPTRDELVELFKSRI